MLVNKNKKSPLCEYTCRDEIWSRYHPIYERNYMRSSLWAS